MLLFEKNPTNGIIARFPAEKQRLNVLVADEFKKQLYKVIDEGETVLIIDFSNINFIDSSGFGALIAVLNHARNHQVLFKLCCIAPTVMSLIKITKLDQVLEIYDTLEKARQ